VDSGAAPAEVAAADSAADTPPEPGAEGRPLYPIYL